MDTSVAEGDVRKMFDELEILKKVLPVIPCGDDVPVGPGDDCAAIDLGNGTMLLAAVEQLGLSARAFDRILRVARTIADLAGAETPTDAHLFEAIQFRQFESQLRG